MNPSPKLNSFGSPWYRREDYEKLKSLIKDARNLPPTFDEWLTKAEIFNNAASQKGFTVIKIIVEPSALTAWCAEHAIPCNHQSTGKYVAFMAANKLAEMN